MSDNLRLLRAAKRIAVVGPMASGKTTFANLLKRTTALPLIHMDSLLWQPDWTKTPKELAQANHDKAIMQDRWIIEGWMDPKFRNRAERADLIFHLDYSAPTLVWRYLNRINSGAQRPEVGEGCVEKFNPRALATRVLRWDNFKINRALHGIDESKIIRFSSPDQADQFMAKPQLLPNPSPIY